jgi:hypothetical protein
MRLNIQVVGIPQDTIRITISICYPHLPEGERQRIMCETMHEFQLAIFDELKREVKSLVAQTVEQCGLCNRH